MPSGCRTWRLTYSSKLNPEARSTSVPTTAIAAFEYFVRVSG